MGIIIPLRSSNLQLSSTVMKMIAKTFIRMMLKLFLVVRTNGKPNRKRSCSREKGVKPLKLNSIKPLKFKPLLLPFTWKVTPPIPLTTMTQPVLVKLML
mmetsp:Transcript_17954/g.32133  ORF Transcript_17954/g.32133 Transcript_17954/m.32133 type:complete len:99 (-) Transcript_17954:368-664(-)